LAIRQRAYIVIVIYPTPSQLSFLCCPLH